MLTKPLLQAKLGKEKRRAVRGKTGDLACDEGVFEKLKALRRKLAEERNVPAYIVFSDVTLREMAAKLPRTKSQLLEVSGVGEKKLDQYGQVFLEEIARSLG
jgi:ATP-dependent DNA helicase RecQ